MGMGKLRMTPCALLCSVGGCLNLLWCSLMGHTLGFMPASDGLAGAVNPRVFFLAGILLASLVFFAIPRSIRKANGVFIPVLPLLSAVGTACFALAYRQDLFDSAMFAAGGLCVSGVGYFWLVARFNLLLARTQLFSCAVWSIALALFAKLVVLGMFGLALDSGLQIAVAVCLPVASAVVFELARREARKQAERHPWLYGGGQAGGMGSSVGGVVSSEFGIASRPRAVVLSHAEKRDLMVIVAVAAIVLAVVRAMSYLGTWGNTHTTLSDSLAWAVGFMLGGACLFVFARFALVGPQERSMAIRFQPAILVTLAGMFAMALPVPDGAAGVLLGLTVQLDELFAHLLFWCAIIAALDVLDVPSYRVIGFACSIYAAVSIAWVLLMGSTSAISAALILVVAYVAVVCVMRVSRGASSRRGEGAFVRVENSQGAEGDSPASDAREKLRSLIEERCGDMAEQYGLSPREREVFELMARGLTRSDIQDELVLSPNTVKTHVAHIYAKLGVHDRQEMLALMIGRFDSAGGDCD